ncbi:MAG: SPOR domain-containing protein [Bacteroidia bacterium]|nr:SPOR domain-containing protein [Bacteroidia bacterium]MCZ2247981.1 SPOR domain-containing protein [Bacteroidia bacterium]
MELKIDNYIEQLLYHHNCVIIPSFGGFVANYKGAQIHPTQYSFTAPSKQLAFNKNLINNDGLLAGYIASVEKISFEEALILIDKDVFKIKKLLTEGQQVIFKSIGFLKLDIEKNIRFNPSNQTNFETSSFGLNTFQSPAIIRGGYTKGLPEPVFTDKTTKKKRFTFKQYKKFALPMLVLPLALILYFSPVYHSVIQSFSVQTSGFWGNDSKTSYTPPQHQPLKEIAEPVESENTETVAIEPTVSDNAEINATTNENIEPVADIKVPEPVQYNSVEPVNSGKYQLISGCFSMQENAYKQIDLLQQKNIHAYISGQSKSGLYRVSCGGFDNQEQAIAEMSKLIAGGTDIWILKN